MGTPMKAPVTDEEKKAINQLVGSITELCNDRMSELLEAEGLESLRKFDITIFAVSLQFGCDESVAEEMKSRHQKREDENLTYFG